jgi:hypothetical protein
LAKANAAIERSNQSVMLYRNSVNSSTFSAKVSPWGEGYSVAIRAEYEAIAKPAKPATKAMNDADDAISTRFPTSRERAAPTVGQKSTVAMSAKGRSTPMVFATIAIAVAAFSISSFP